jgi:hypothetical protein
MTIREYIDRITKRYESGTTLDQPYREDLKQLVESAAPDIVMTEVTALAACGTPDYTLVKKSTPLGYIKTFSVHTPLDGRESNGRLDLCKTALPNLILTNYFEFHLYRDGKLASSVSIAGIRDGKPISRSSNIPAAQALINTLIAYERISIGTASDLSLRMAGKAKLLACVIENAILRDEQEWTKTKDAGSKRSLKEQLAEVDLALKIDISGRDLANIYAQTIPFGMFAARLYGGPSLEAWSRYNAVAFIPVAYPFLKKLFQYIAGKDLDERLAWIINELAALFSAISIPALLENLRESARQNNPVKQFYEKFLDEYNPGLLEERGEISATEPIIRFVHQAVMDGRSSFQSGSNARQR